MPTGLDPIVVSLGIADSPSRRERDVALKDRSGNSSAPPQEEPPAAAIAATAVPPAPSVPGPTEFIAAVAGATLPIPSARAAYLLRARDGRWAPPPSTLSLTDRSV